MSADIPGFIVLDTAMFVVLIAGGVLGYYRGAVKSLILLLSIYIPYLVYLHFSDHISAYINLAISLTTGSNTASLGILSTLSGLMGGMGLFAGFFLASRLVLRVFSLHEPQMREKLAGVLIGVTGNQIMALVSLMLVFMALPAATTEVTSKSLWWKASKPLARVIYPSYRALILDRTENLRMAIAEDGLIRALAEGGVAQSTEDLEKEINKLVKGGVGQAMNLTGEWTGELQEMVKTIDIDGLQEEINTLIEQGLTPEDVDRKIREEDARRRQMLDQQLGSGG